MKRVIIYHKSCNDGFGAAWAAWKKFGDKASYIGAEHGDPIPKGLKNSDVFLVDFSYPKKDLTRINKIAARLTVIDHHISAKADIRALPNSVFDNDHSGAVLAWAYFHPSEKTPRLLRHIEDVDLWKFRVRYTKEIIASLALSKFDFRTWGKLARELENKESFKKHIEIGKVILSYENKVVEKAIRRANAVRFEGYKALAANSNVLTSEIGNRLVKIMPPIAIIFSEVKGKKIVSLRSNGKADVSKLAAKYGGGGHKAAAGFHLKLNARYPWKILPSKNF